MAALPRRRSRRWVVGVLLCARGRPAASLLTHPLMPDTATVRANSNLPTLPARRVQSNYTGMGCPDTKILVCPQRPECSSGTRWQGWPRRRATERVFKFWSAWVCRRQPRLEPRLLTNVTLDRLDVFSDFLLSAGELEHLFVRLAPSSILCSGGPRPWRRWPRA
jgi:hypothetical protein